MRTPTPSSLTLLALLATAAFVGPTSAQPNLLVNPGFETAGGSYTGWFTFGSGVQMSTPATDNIFRSGTAASKTFGGFVGCPNTPAFNVGGYGQALTPTGGYLYELRGWSFISSTDAITGTNTCANNRMLAKIAFFNAPSGGSEIGSNEVVIGDGNSPLDTWTEFVVKAPTPAGAQRVEVLFLYLQPACAGGAVFVDDVSFTGAPEVLPSNVLANPSFTTGLSGWSTFGNVFAETRSFARRSATGSAKLFSTFVANSPSGLFQSAPTTAGKQWRVDLYTLNTCQESPIIGTNDNLGLARIVFRNSLDVEIGSAEVQIAGNTAPLGNWTPYSVTSVAPAGAVTVQVYILFISPTLQGGAYWVDDVSLREVPIVGVPGGPNGSLSGLRQNAPNPFTRSTRIDFVLAREDDVSIRVLDIAGREVASLLDRRMTAGSHQVQWDGRRANGTNAPAGIYQCVMTTSTGHSTKRMVLQQ